MKTKPALVLISLLFIVSPSIAQQAMTINGNIQVHGSASLSVFGDLKNTAAAVLIDNGNIYVRGNLVNDQSAMTPGTGTVYLSGSSVQTISGSQPFKVNNLVTNNSAGILLNVNLSVTGIHTFTAGLVATSSSPNFLVYESGSSSTGSNDSRHVTGWVKKYGNTDFVFPVGDATYQRTIAISNLTAVSEINCHYYTPTQNIFNLLSPLVQVKANEYWQLDKVSGGNTRVNLNWEHLKVPMDNILLDDIMASQYTAGKWTDAGGIFTATGVVTSTGSVSSNSLAALGPFTLGYTSFPVPLKLISFTTERKRGINYLKWITDNEQNVDHFEIQRSYDAVNFSDIASVSARNRGWLENYSFDDRSILKGSAWYRIRIVDRDGKFFYSRITVVSEKAVLSGSFLIANPVRNVITIFNKSGETGLFNCRLLNLQGQLITEGLLGMTNNGKAELFLPAQSSAGIYLLQIHNTKIQFTQKILLEK